MRPECRTLRIRLAERACRKRSRIGSARILDDYLVAVEQGAADQSRRTARAASGGCGVSARLLERPANVSRRGGCAASRSDRSLIGEAAAGADRSAISAWCARSAAAGWASFTRRVQISLRRPRARSRFCRSPPAHDAKQISRFKNEAQAAAQVQHPNIVPVYAVGEENGVHYYAMQLIEGQSLADVARPKSDLMAAQSDRGINCGKLPSLDVAD